MLSWDGETLPMVADSKECYTVRPIEVCGCGVRGEGRMGGARWTVWRTACAGGKSGKISCVLAGSMVY